MPMYMRRLMSQLDISKYHLDIYDIIDNGEIICFSSVHHNWVQCTQTNILHNIVFYDANIEPLLMEFIEDAKQMTEFPNARHQMLYGCPICGYNL